jgi:hypothetical protein
MHLACILGHIETIKLLVEFKGGLNSVDSNMNVPLQYLIETTKFYANKEGQENKVKKLEIVAEILQEKGAKMTWRTGN